MEELTTSQVSERLPCGIYYGDDMTVEVCAANCPGGEDVIKELIKAEVSFSRANCLGGCAIKKITEEGVVHVKMPELTEHEGYRPARKILRTEKREE